MANLPACLCEHFCLRKQANKLEPEPVFFPLSSGGIFPFRQKNPPNRNHKISACRQNNFVDHATKLSKAEMLSDGRNKKD
jgi:hypothetical protein